jgi:hypothetical protein
LTKNRTKGFVPISPRRRLFTIEVNRSTPLPVIHNIQSIKEGVMLQKKALRRALWTVVSNVVIKIIPHMPVRYYERVANVVRSYDR